MPISAAIQRCLVFSESQRGLRIRQACGYKWSCRRANREGRSPRWRPSNNIREPTIATRSGAGEVDRTAHGQRGCRPLAAKMIAQRPLVGPMRPVTGHVLIATQLDHQIERHNRRLPRRRELTPGRVAGARSLLRWGWRRIQTLRRRKIKRQWACCREAAANGAACGARPR